MDPKRSEADKPERTFDSAYTFSFAIAIGLILFIAGLVISLTLGEGTSLGLIFGIPLLVAGILVPLVMMRDLFTRGEISEPCPYCGTTIKTSDSTLRLQCPSCKGIVVVSDGKLLP